MRSPIYRVFVFAVLVFLCLSLFSPIRQVTAAINPIALTDNNFLDVPENFYADALQQKLVETGSPLASHQEQVGDQLFTAGQSLWTASQRKDYGLNPKVLLVTLVAEGSLQSPPSGSFTSYAQHMSQTLWDGFSSYSSEGNRLTLANGQTIDIIGNNAATFALAYYFSSSIYSEANLTNLLTRWLSTFQDIFHTDPTQDLPRLQAAPDIEPFLRLPFSQPSQDFVRINSFFDHVSPGITFDDTLLRFDGIDFSNASFNGCTLGVNCYGGHNGIDYSTGAGMPILAAASGTVVYRYFNTDPSQGDVDSGLIIDHGNGYRTAYWHMDPIQVSYGQAISQGQQVGLSGNVGKSSGAHLHFGLRITSGNKSVDPFGWWGSQADPWGDSKWMWSGNLTADNREAQAQLFYRNYWNHDSSGYNGESWYTYSVNSASSSTNWGIWGAYLATAGRYDVFAYWPKHSDNTINARYKIFHANGVTTVAKDQSTDGDQFVYLGTFDFNRGATLVMLSDLTNDSGKKVYFDAVRWAFHSELPPTDLNLSNSTIVENQPVGTSVGSFTTTDPELGDSFTYSLVSGTGSTDNASFSINGDQLLTKAIFDFETKNSYSIRVRTTDLGGHFYEEAFTISVTNANDPPHNILLSKSSISENQPAGSTIGTLSASDQDASDTHTFSLVSGAGSDDNTNFSITGNVLKTTASFDFETKNNYSIRVKATDNHNASFEKPLTVTVADANDAPTDITLSKASVLENQPVGTQVGLISAVDQDAGDTHSYNLVSGSGSTDNAFFTINGNQLRTANVFDAETKNTCSIRLRATDSAGAFFEKQLTITIDNVNEFDPTGLSITSTYINENQPPNTTVGTLSTTDQDVGDVFTYSLVTGEGSQDNGTFNINGAALRAKASLDYEAQNTYHVRIRTTDSGGKYYEAPFTITVLDQNDPPTDIALSNATLAENLAAGTKVGTLTAADQDAGSRHNYQLVNGTGATDNPSFAINESTLLTSVPLDYEAKHNYSIRIRVTDNLGATFEKVFTITVTNVNDPPSALALSKTSVLELQPIGTQVGSFTTTDQDAGDSHSYSLVSGTGSQDNSSFTIEGSTLKTNAVFNRDLRSSYSIRVRTTDSGGLYFEKSFTITVLRYNYPPTDLSLSKTSVNENKAPGTTVGTFTSTDPNKDDTFTYSLVTGNGSTDNSSFSINGSKLKTAIMFDYETKNHYSIRVRSTDRGGLYFEKAFTITIGDVNEAPTSINLSHSSIAENLPVGSTVGTLSAVDPDLNDSHAFSLVSGTGSADNSSFTIQGNLLVSARVFDFEVKNNYEIRVRTTDIGGLQVEKQFTIRVSDANDLPTDIDLTNSRIPENLTTGTSIGILSTTDQDTGDSHIYSLVAGIGDSGNPYFAISGNLLLTNAVFDYESISSYTIRLRSTDQAGGFYEEIFTIDILPVNEYAPTGILLQPDHLPENRAPGTQVGVLAAVDQDMGDPHTFELVSGLGSTDNNAFYIEDGVLKTSQFFNFEKQSSYSIRVCTIDSGGLIYEQALTIHIQDQLEFYLPLI